MVHAFKALSHGGVDRYVDVQAVYQRKACNSNQKAVSLKECTRYTLKDWHHGTDRFLTV